MSDEFNVSLPEALEITGLSRVTFYRRRQFGLPFKRDEQSGRVFFRRRDLEKLRRWQSNETLREELAA